MIKRIINKIWNVEGHDDVITPNNQFAKFILQYNNLEIGTLSLEKGIWKFTYSDQFKSQTDIQPIIDFPDISQEYKSNHLWPFFSYRIPGLNQPQVQNIIKKEHIDKSNEAELLKKFGFMSIYNPFLLKNAL
jgi:HipA-like protein